ncbi:MAG: YceI family protein [Bacteroidota bacterium]
MKTLRFALMAAVAVGLAACGTDDAAVADADGDVSTAGTFVDAPALPSGTYAIDASHSRAEFRVRHLGITNVTGGFDSVTGTLEVGDGLGSLQANAVIDASTINTGNADRDNHLRSPDFFDVAQYPEITFNTTAVRPGDGGAFTLVGDLTMHGVTQPVELDAEYLGSVTAMDGTEKVGFVASGEIDRTAYGLTWNQALEAGGVLVGEQVTLDLEIQADLQAGEEAASEA